LWNQQGSHVHRGSLISSRSDAPALRRAIYCKLNAVRCPNCGWWSWRCRSARLRPTFEAAMAALFGGGASTSARRHRRLLSAIGRSGQQPAQPPRGASQAQERKIQCPDQRCGADLSTTSSSRRRQAREAGLNWKNKEQARGAAASSSVMQSLCASTRGNTLAIERSQLVDKKAVRSSVNRKRHPKTVLHFW